MARWTRGTAALAVTGAVLASLLVPAAASADVAGVGMALPLALPNGLAVSGTVTDEGGQPVAGATAGVCRLWYDCFVAFDATDAQGHWQVRGLAPGTYFVEVLPAYGMNLLSSAWTGPGTSSHDLVTAVAVDVSSNRTGMDMVMPTGLRITGDVTGPDGQPVAGVTVFASGATAATSSVPSNADGEWQAVGLEPGVDYMLQVLAPAGLLSGWFDGSGVVQVPGDGPVFTLDAADVTGVHVDVAAGRHVGGHLDGAEGLDVDVFAMGGGGGASGTVDPDGDFTLAGLWPGQVVVIFAPHPVGVMDNEFPYGTWQGQGELLDPAQGMHLVDLTAGDVLDLQAVVPVLPSVSGSVTDSSGALEGATVAVCDTSDTPVCLQVTSGPGGAWRARNVPAGTYHVRAGTAAHPTAWWAGGPSSTASADAADVSVDVEDVAGLDIAIPDAKEIRGWVTGPDGLGVAGVEVTAIPEGRFDDEWGPGPAITDADGMFAVRGLIPGDYRICARPAQGSVLRAGCWTANGFTATYEAAELVHVVAVDAVAPLVSGLSARLAVGTSLSGTLVPVRVRWTATDDTSGIDHAAVRLRAGTGGWATVDVTHGATRDVGLSAGGTLWQIGVSAVDGSANPSGLATTKAFSVSRVQESSAQLAWAGRWSSSLTTAATGGAHSWTGTAGSAMTYRFTGRSVGWVAPTGPGYGRARVYVDGVLVQTVDLHATTPSWRRVVFARSWSTTGDHVLRIVCAGTVGHPRISVDALVVLR